MAVKYFCPKCEKRYIDWGAEKLNFECPECDGEKMVQVGRREGEPVVKRPTLKRKKKKKAKAKAPPPTATTLEDDDDITAPDISSLTGEDVDQTEDVDSSDDDDVEFESDDGADGVVEGGIEVDDDSEDEEDES